MESRCRLLAVIAAVVVVAVLLSSTGGVIQVRNSPTPSGAPFAAAVSAGATIPVGSYPYGITFDPVNGLLYVTNFGSNNISVVNATTNRVVAWIPMPFGIETLAVDSSTGFVYVAEAVYQVYAINPSTNRVQWTIPLLDAGCPFGCAPHVQTYDTANGDIYVTDLTSDNVTAIHGNQPVAVVPVGSGPNGAAYDSANGNIYVSNEGASVSSINLTVINGSSDRVVGQVSGSGGGPGVAYDGSNGDVYVCQNAGEVGQSNFVTVVDGNLNQILASIPIRSSCQGAVYDPANDYVYITDRFVPGGPDLSDVTIVDPTTNGIVLRMPTQLGPTGITYDSANHNIYVADSDTNNVSILPQIYRLNVRESGLPPGTNWSATVGGTTFFSTTPTISFPETNGTLNFSVGPAVNLTASPSSGQVTVNGGPQWLNVTFSKGGGGSGLLGLPGATGYYVLGGSVVVLVAATVVVVVLTRRKRRAKPSPSSPPTNGPTDLKP